MAEPLDVCPGDIRWMIIMPGVYGILLKLEENAIIFQRS